MTQVPSPEPNNSKVVSTTSRNSATINPKPPKLPSKWQMQQWSLKSKTIVVVTALSILPVLAIGVSSYLCSRLTYREILQARQTEELVKAEQALERQMSSLLVGTGITAVLASAIATFIANRAINRVLNASAVAATVTNRLRREENSTVAKIATVDELVALETNLRLIEQQLPELLWKQENEAERSRLLMNISRRIWGVRSQEEVFRTAVEEIRQAFKMDRVSVFCFDKNWDGTFVAEAVTPGWPKVLWSSIKDPCFAGGYVEQYRQGRVRAIDNIYQAGLGDCHIGLLERFAVKANLVAPITKDNQLYGLLIAHQCFTPRIWQQFEIDLFAQLAAQVGFALNHVRLLEQIDTKADQAEVLINLIRRIRESLNEESILKTTVEETRKVLRADRVIIFGFDANWYGKVIAESVVPGFPKALRAKIKDPCFAQGYVEQYQAGRVQATNNIYEAGLTPCHIRQLEPFSVQANLVAPILKEDKLFGLLIAHQCSGPREWQQSEIDLLTQLAAQVGFALDHARLVEQIEQAYEVAETAAFENSQQKETILHQVSELLRDNETALQTLAVDVSSQTEFVQTTYNYIQALAEKTQGMITTIQQVELHKQQVNQELQAEHEIIVRCVDGGVVLQQVIIEAAEKVKYLDQCSQNLLEVVELINNFVSEIILQTMNATLEVSRGNKVSQELNTILGKVLTSAHQLKASIASIKKLVAKIQAQTQEVAVSIGVGTEQATAETQLLEATQRKLNQIATVNTQMNLLLEEIAQAAINQTQTVAAASRAILEVASITNHTSEQFMAVTKSFNKLAVVAQEFPAKEFDGS